METLFTPYARGVGAPTEKELEGIPPLNFEANGEPLLDWSMDGANGGVGDPTANLYDKKTAPKLSEYIGAGELITTSVNTISTYLTCKPNTTYTVYRKAGTRFAVAYTYEMPELGGTCYGRITDNTASTITITTDANAKYLFIYYYHASYDTDTETEISNSLMIVEGSTAPSEYIPYGYEISITCGGETKTMLLDAPLGASDSISMTDTGISIPTVSGSNTLSVGTTVRPSSVYIKYKRGGDEMVTLAKIGGRYNTALLEIRGLSTDTKPTTEIERMIITNGSTYIEIDTGDTYMFDAENGVWHNITG